MPVTSQPQQQQQQELSLLSTTLINGSNMNSGNIGTGSSCHLPPPQQQEDEEDVVPSPSSMMILMDTNISPNPVVMVHPTPTHNTNMNMKRVEFNFVPNMCMFENDMNENDHKMDENDNEDPLRSTSSTISSSLSLMHVNPETMPEEEEEEGNNDASLFSTTTTTTTTTSVTNHNHHNNTNHVGGGAVLWDTETDHMLSYFLSGNDQGPTATIDFTTMMPSSSTITTTTASTTKMIDTEPTNANAVRDSTLLKRSSHDGTTKTTKPINNNNNDHHHHHILPPTPAVHFYSNSTPQSSNVYPRHVTGNTLNEEHPLIPNNNSTAGSTQQPLQIYPTWSSQQLPPMTGGSTSTTAATTQSQSSSSSSLSSLANHHQIQLYHQQLQMQRILAGSGGGHSISNNTNGNNTNTMYFSSLSHQQQQQPSPPLSTNNNNNKNNTRLYSQMLVYPPPISLSHSNSTTSIGGDTSQPIPPSSMNLFDGESPLSPAAMIGTPSQHENLFLPRSNSFYENSSKKSPHDTTGDSTAMMGPPVSRQPSQNDISSAMASATLASTNAFVWPPPGTMSSPSILSNHHHHMATTTTIPTLPYHMMAPFLTNPTSHDPMIHNTNNMPSLLPNLQPFMYTAANHNNTIPQQPSSSMSNSTMPSSSLSSQSPLPTQPPPPINEEESEEKRNKRLERNRESARKCRLKKKERLHTLGMQVTELHKTIEQERRTIINNMVPILMQHCRQHEIMNCSSIAINNHNNNHGNEGQRWSSNHSNYNNNNSHNNNPLTDIIRRSGPSSTMMRSVLEFQYSTLKDITLPHYEKLLLWFTTQKESYYTIGKEQYYIEQQKKIKQQSQQPSSSSSSPPPNSNGSNEVASVATTESSTTAATSGYSTTINNIRPNAIKISSKQIGEELMTGSSNNHDDAPPSKKRSSKSNGSTNGGIMSSAVYDGTKTWPLFCYELKLSVDQEERFVGKHKQIIFEDDNQVKSKLDATSDSTYRSLLQIREEMAVAVTTTESLGKAVGTLSHMIAQRDENTYLNILHPSQVSKYYHWLSQHRPEVRQMMFQHHQPDVMEHATTGPQSPTLPSAIDMDSDPSSTQSSLSATDGGNVPGDSTSLHAISRRLSEVLQISSRQQYSNGELRSSNQNR